MVYVKPIVPSCVYLDLEQIIRQVPT
jgi:hypothetical protein